MLSFDEKLAILSSFPELQRKDVSLGRVNFHYEQSSHDKKTVAYRFHPNGNGFVYGGLLDGYAADEKGFVNIRDFSADDLRTIIERSIASLSANKEDSPLKKEASSEASWHGPDGQMLLLKHEEDMWYVYSGLSLEMAFETREEAEHYLLEEGFERQPM